MALKKLTYFEYKDDPRYWALESLDFTESNLIVGRNATGKTRLVHVITGLMQMLAGTKIGALDSGSYVAEFHVAGRSYIYEIAFHRRTVVKEKLLVDGRVRLERSEDGKGRIHYAKEGTDLDFEVELSAIAFQSRRDRLQHPFITDLADWAASSATYMFGSEMGRNTLAMLMTAQTASKELEQEDPNNALATYIEGFKKYRDAFDKAIIEDMIEMGFPLREVHAKPLDPSVAASSQGQLTALTVAEDGLSVEIPQIFISQGMYRALALTIKLNWAMFSNRKGLLVIDDLGEGLDYERACAVVKMTMEKAKASGSQVIITSNDRFVMNSVPLESWVVLQRQGGTVRAFTPRNSTEQFENFRFTGLSNFDFFTSQAFH
ncbi:AAA family ATPase [Kinneretia aquatilis]|uniref:AAA family ATPase n=1 Tax=Kinneretia aquatilis TaxID=2070761 RepID=UPI0014953983|nr:AAA family ATPase [Paucibacter aquatile]WIV97161.1 AAA family ATPase [Paucibacter aquatile]